MIDPTTFDFSSLNNGVPENKIPTVNPQNKNLLMKAIIGIAVIGLGIYLNYEYRKNLIPYNEY